MPLAVCMSATSARYNAAFMGRDLAAFISQLSRKAAASTSVASIRRDFLVMEAPEQLPVWHLVGGVDALRALI